MSHPTTPRHFGPRGDLVLGRKDELSTPKVGSWLRYEVLRRSGTDSDTESEDEFDKMLEDMLEESLQEAAQQEEGAAGQARTPRRVPVTPPAPHPTSFSASQQPRISPPPSPTFSTLGTLEDDFEATFSDWLNTEPMVSDFATHRSSTSTSMPEVCSPQIATASSGWVGGLHPILRSMLFTPPSQAVTTNVFVVQNPGPDALLADVQPSTTRPSPPRSPAPLQPSNIGANNSSSPVPAAATDGLQPDKIPPHTSPDLKRSGDSHIRERSPKKAKGGDMFRIPSLPMPRVPSSPATSLPFKRPPVITMAHTPRRPSSVESRPRLSNRHTNPPRTGLFPMEPGPATWVHDPHAGITGSPPPPPELSIREKKVAPRGWLQAPSQIEVEAEDTQPEESVTDMSDEEEISAPRMDKGKGKVVDIPGIHLSPPNPSPPRPIPHDKRPRVSIGELPDPKRAKLNDTRTGDETVPVTPEQTETAGNMSASILATPESHNVTTRRPLARLPRLRIAVGAVAASSSSQGYESVTPEPATPEPQDSPMDIDTQPDFGDDTLLDIYLADLDDEDEYESPVRRSHPVIRPRPPRRRRMRTPAESELLRHPVHELTPVREASLEPSTPTPERRARRAEQSLYRQVLSRDVGAAQTVASSPTPQHITPEESNSPEVVVDVGDGNLVDLAALPSRQDAPAPSPSPSQTTPSVLSPSNKVSEDEEDEDLARLAALPSRHEAPPQTSTVPSAVAPDSPDYVPPKFRPRKRAAPVVEEEETSPKKKQEINRLDAGSTSTVSLPAVLPAVFDESAPSTLAASQQAHSLSDFVAPPTSLPTETHQPSSTAEPAKRAAAPSVAVAAAQPGPTRRLRSTSAVPSQAAEAPDLPLPRATRRSRSVQPQAHTVKQNGCATNTASNAPAGPDPQPRRSARARVPSARAAATEGKTSSVAPIIIVKPKVKRTIAVKKVDQAEVKEEEKEPRAKPQKATVKKATAKKAKVKAAMNVEAAKTATTTKKAPKAASTTKKDTKAAQVAVPSPRVTRSRAKPI